MGQGKFPYLYSSHRLCAVYVTSCLLAVLSGPHIWEGPPQRRGCGFIVYSPQLGAMDKNYQGLRIVLKLKISPTARAVL